jgi:hypothetical protein
MYRTFANIIYQSFSIQSNTKLHNGDFVLVQQKSNKVSPEFEILQDPDL